MNSSSQLTCSVSRSFTIQGARIDRAKGNTSGSMETFVQHVRGHHQGQFGVLKIVEENSDTVKNTIFTEFFG